jgi:hypothetical protein
MARLGAAAGMSEAQLRIDIEEKLKLVKNIGSASGYVWYSFFFFFFSLKNDIAL